MKPLNRQRRIVLLGGGLIAGIGAAVALIWGGYQVPVELLAPTLVLNLAIGWSFIGVGLVAWSRRPDSRTGLLMVLLGFAVFARLSVAIASDAGFSVGVVMGSVYLSLLVHLLVSFPSGRLTTWSSRVIVTVGYLLGAPLDLFFLAQGAQRGLGNGLPPNGIVITPQTGPFDPQLVDLLIQTIVVLMFTALLVVVLARWRRASGAQRRTLAPGVWGGAAIVLTIIAERGVLFFGAPPGLGVGLRWSAQVVLVVWPLALLLGLLRSHLDRSAVSRMIVELGAGFPPGDRLRTVLASALHDPSLELAYWLPERQAFVDADGATVDLPTADARTVTYLARDGARIAVLVHDAALAAEPELVEAVAAGAGLAIDNERLQAEVRAQLREVHASRARIVEAAYSARREVERNLHDGAQQRLLSVALALRLARRQLGGEGERAGGRGSVGEVSELLEDASTELAGALDELRELARGIYPVLLTDSGLGPALQSLADRSPVRAVLTAAPAGRLPGPVEQTCYFVVSEALANAAKHAAAAEISIGVREHAGQVTVEIADDGVGGADPTGSGLHGLTDRVAALGGLLRVDSPVGGGTRVIAELPCA